MSKLIKSFNVYVGEPAKVEEPVINFDEPEEVKNEEESEIYHEIEGSSEEEILENSRQKAEEIIKKAIEQSKKITEEAMTKVEEEREIVLEQAEKNGFQEGYNQALSQFEYLIQEAGGIKQQALDEYAEIMGNVEQELLTIIFDIAKKVVGNELASKEEDILYIVRDALESCTHKDYVLLKVSEEDYEIITKSKNKLLAMVKGIGEIEIKVDHSLERGSCLLETPFGAVDGSLKTKLEQIENVFTGLVEK